MQRGPFCAVGYDEVLQSDTVTCRYIGEVKDVSELAHHIQQNKVLSQYPT
jgi:hypothetical protein